MKNNLLKKVVILLQLLAFIFVSCDDDNAVEDKIVLETKDIKIWVEQEETIGVLSYPTNLEVISENDQIASANLFIWM